jgi:RimJ/RimL family protein N-acetyltransferase
VLELRPFAPDDYQRLIGWATSPELLAQWAGAGSFDYPLTEAQLEAYRQTGLGPNAESRIFTAVLAGATPVGHIELGFIRPDNGTGSVCRVLIGPEWRGRGLGTEMVRALLRFGFEAFGLRRIDLRVYGFNETAIRCYTRVGMVREGCLRQGVRVGGQLWDVVLMAILREEWAAQQQPTQPSV